MMGYVHVQVSSSSIFSLLSSFPQEQQTAESRLLFLDQVPMEEEKEEEDKRGDREKLLLVGSSTVHRSPRCRQHMRHTGERGTDTSLPFLTPL